MEKVATVFNGTYTVSSPSGEHRTFRIKTQKDDARFAPGQRVIGLLNGPDNENSYKSFGFVSDNGIRIFNKLKGTNDKPSSYDWFAHILWDLQINGEQSKFYGKGYRVLLSGSCIRCNRKLSVPSSIISGIGPECIKYWR